MEEVPTVTIPVTEYERLKERERWLSAMEAAGVDNWQGIDVAVEMMEENP